jgi:hypothetical protein
MDGAGVDADPASIEGPDGVGVVELGDNQRDRVRVLRARWRAHSAAASSAMPVVTKPPHARGWGGKYMLS